MFLGWMIGTSNLLIINISLFFLIFTNVDMELHWRTAVQDEEAYNPHKRLISFENALTNKQ